MIRFWSKVDIRSQDECWLWIASLSHNGYGKFKLNGHMQKAHRIAYIFAYGPILPEFLICHSCDNPACCNPRHLFHGSTQENINDRELKQRTFSKLTNDEVLRILKDDRVHSKIAQEYNISRSRVGKIKSGKSWRKFHFNLV